MLFNSTAFLFAFLPLVLIVYYLLPHRRQNAFLVIASLFFYASWDWRFLFPLLFTTLVDYWVARQLEVEHAAASPSKRKLKQYVLISIVSNLTLLAFFKYFNFFTQSAVTLAHAVGVNIQLTVFEIVLPLAISFYTFQALSYTIDVYRGQLHATKSFGDFFLAVLYFPHLIAGPIQRAATLLPQVVNPRRITRLQINDGLHLILWGLFKKVYIADNLAPIANAVFADPSPTGAMTLIGIYAFTFQIYCDFSGYTDIARGIAKIMGFEFNLNFNLPYFATNPSDFWRRWHISLSQWLQDYLYKPLGGNRGGGVLTYRNLLITMVLGGLWHGAAWNFIVWGLYHGCLLIGHRLLTPMLQQLDKLISSPRVWLAIRIVSMFLLTCYGWLLFRATSIHQIIAMTGALQTPFAGMDMHLLARISGFVLPLAIVQAIQLKTGELQFMGLPWISSPVKVVIYSVLVYLMVFSGGQPQAFVYFQF